MLYIVLLCFFSNIIGTWGRAGWVGGGEAWGEWLGDTWLDTTSCLLCRGPSWERIGQCVVLEYKWWPLPWSVGPGSLVVQNQVHRDYQTNTHPHLWLQPMKWPQASPLCAFTCKSWANLFSSFCRKGRIETNNKDKPFCFWLMVDFENRVLKLYAWCCLRVSSSVVLVRGWLLHLCLYSSFLPDGSAFICIFLCIIIL